MVGRDIASESTRREEMPEATKVTSWPAGVGQPISESRILPLKMHIWQFDHIRRTEKVRVKKGYILTSRDVVGLCVWLRTKDGALRYANLTNWRDWGYCRPADSDMSISTTLQIASDYSEWVSKFEGCNMRMEWPNWALGRGRGQIDLVSEQQQNIVKNPSARECESDPHKLIDMLLAAGGLGHWGYLSHGNYLSNPINWLTCYSQLVGWAAVPMAWSGKQGHALISWDAKTWLPAISYVWLVILAREVSGRVQRCVVNELSWCNSMGLFYTDLPLFKAGTRNGWVVGTLRIVCSNGQ